MSEIDRLVEALYDTFHGIATRTLGATPEQVNVDLKPTLKDYEPIVRAVLEELRDLPPSQFYMDDMEMPGFKRTIEALLAEEPRP